MAKRLTKIVTRTGDDGTTGLGDGTRVRKDALRVAAMGDVDELSSAIGCVLAEPLRGDLRDLLASIQNDLFDLGGEVCIPGRAALRAAHVERLDAGIERLRATLPALREFVLPGGKRAGAACHLARAVCRRAERSLVALRAAEGASDLSIQYLNRLSDALFLCARAINAAEGAPETLWKPGANVEG